MTTKKLKAVRAWAIQRIEDGDISNKLFETRVEARDSMAALPNAYFKVVQVEIRPIKGVRRAK